MNKSYGSGFKFQTIQEYKSAQIDHELTKIFKMNIKDL